MDIDGYRDPIPNFWKMLVEHFGSKQKAWEWLTTDNEAFRMKPIDLIQVRRKTELVNFVRRMVERG